MTSPEELKELKKLSDEFYADDTTRERRIEIVTRVRDMAERNMPESRCLNCKRGGVAIEHDEALIEGHCYSTDGIRDYTRITKICEFCFDKMHEGLDEEEPDGTGS